MDRKDATKPPYDRRRSDPWREEIRRDIDERHIENQRRFQALENDSAKMKADLAKNTELTESVKSDTATLVALTRGGNALKKFLIWSSPIAAALFAGLAWWGHK